jgi:outer membrane biosynthesis protein TonB
MKLLYALVAVCVLASGCTKARAKTIPDAPLDMPLPPPREVETPEAAEPPAPATLVTEPERTLPPRPRPAPRERPRAEPPKPDPSKAEPPKPEPPPPEPAKPAEEPPAPTTVQTSKATADAGVERDVRATLARARMELSRIDPNRLNADAKIQYDSAQRFIRQANDAMDPKSKNLVFAKNLADKAAVIAAQLAGR